MFVPLVISDALAEMQLVVMMLQSGQTLSVAIEMHGGLHVRDKASVDALVKICSSLLAEASTLHRICAQPEFAFWAS